MKFLQRLLPRYAAWLSAHALAVVLCAAVLSVLGASLAATLPLRTEFQHLLPDNQPSVIALRKLSARQPSMAQLVVGVSSPDPQATRRLTKDLAAALRKALPRDLLLELSEDDAVLAGHLWRNRHLYASLDDLRRARDELKGIIERETGKANPLFVDLDDDPPARPEAKKDDKPGEKKDDADELLKRLDDLRARAEKPDGFVGEDGRLRMLLLRCAFEVSEPEKGNRLLQVFDETARRLEPKRYHPEASIGYTGDLVTAAREHDLVVRDMATSTLLCLGLVLLVLLLYLRVPRAVLALCLTLLCGCALTFGMTRLCIGQLNASTAFLGSVVAGNGINFGIILVARYLEERRGGQAVPEALTTALSGTVVATLVAALAAGAAYLSLVATSFRGFSEFGVIAGMGMLLCWLASYSLLPALLVLFERRRPFNLPARRTLSLIGDLPRRRGAQVVAAALGVGLVVLGAVGARQLWQHPFDDDLSRLRSRSFKNSELGKLGVRLDNAFGKGLGGGFYVGVDRVEDVPVVVSAVRAAEAKLPPEEQDFARIDALTTILPGTPAEQEEKIALLRELRKLVTKAEPHIEAGSREGRLLEALRPPPEPLRALTAADLPEGLRRQITERDGRVGLLLVLRVSQGYQSWSYKQIRSTVERLRALELPPAIKATVQQSSFESIFVDMMESVQRDGPRATAMSLALVIGLLLLAFGPGRYFLATGLALLGGLFGMLGLMAVFGVRLNFLNFVALPITIGIGVDYPFNVVARLRLELRAGTRGAELLRAVLRSAGAVTLCSATTTIGYAVLLSSDTGAIRSFGMAAILGEFTTLLGALLLVPLLVTFAAERHR